MRDERTGAWEVAAVPQRLRTQMSKRADQVDQALRDRGLDPKAVSAAQQKVVSAQVKEAKAPPGTGGDLREQWRLQAVAADVDPDRVMAAATPGPHGSPPEVTPVADL
ncbi:MAG: relaxase domain-containing protein, partial [Pseudonocardia sp.]|nr:relaxase domain-containing protein [Pseudonocardia sp.]